MAVKFPLAVVISAVDRVSGPLSRIQGKFQKVGATMTGAGRRLSLGVTAPLLALGAVTVNTASTFEFAMNRLLALTDASTSELAALEQQALDLGASTQYSAGQAADAMGNLALAGFRAQEILAATPGILDLAAATSSDLAETATITARALRGMGLPAEETGRLANVLAIAATKANQTLSELGESLKFSAPLAESFGLSLEGAVALASRFADVGFEGSMGGTALRNALLELGKIVREPKSEAFRVLERLGVDPRTLFTAEGKVRDLLGVIDTLRAAGATGLDLGQVFGKRTIGPLLKLVSEGTGNLRELEAALRVEGEAARKAAIMMGGAYGATRRLAAAFEALQISVAKSGLLEAFTKLVDRLTAWLTTASQARPETLRTWTVIALGAAVLGPLLLTMGQLLLLFNQTVIAVRTVIPLFRGLATLIVSRLVPAVASLTVALLTNPFGQLAVAIAAVIALVAALITDFGGLRTKLGQFLNEIRAKFQGWSSAVQAIFRGTFGLAFELAAKLREELGGIWRTLMGPIGTFLLDLFDGDGGARVELGPARRPALAPAAAGGPWLGLQEARVRVDFVNVPRGVRVDRDDPPGARGPLELDLNLGYALGNL